MPDAPHHEAHSRPHTPPGADPFMEFELGTELERLKAENAWSTGHNARTLIKYSDFRVVLMALAANAHLPEHRAGGRLSVQVLSGHIRVKALGRTFVLRSGGLLALDQGVPHDVHAIEDSAVLLTIGWRGESS